VRDEPARDTGSGNGLPGGDCAHGGGQVLGAGVFDHEPASAGAQRGEDVLIEVERGQDQHTGARRFRPKTWRVADATGGLNAVHPGHADVHDDHVQSQLGAERDGLSAVGGCAHDGQAWLRAEDHTESGAYHRVVGDDHHPDRHRDPSGRLLGGIGRVARIRQRPSGSGAARSVPA